jgi:hypothetical protein
MVNSYLKDLSSQDQGGRANLPKLSIPSPPSQEREDELRSAPPVLCPQVLDSRDTPIFSGGLFAGRAGSIGPSVGGQRTDVSVESNSLEGSERARAQSRPPYGGIAPLLWHVQGLESKVESLEDSVPQSFALIHDDLMRSGEIWVTFASQCPLPFLGRR